jgi:hypothetical protein
MKFFNVVEFVNVVIDLYADMIMMKIISMIFFEEYE